METTTQQTTTHWIPNFSLGDAAKAIEKVARKAARLGLPAPTMTLGESRVRDLERTEDGPDGVPVVRTYRVRCTLVTVTSPVVRVAGYTLIASVEPRGEGNLIRSVGGDLPAEWRTCDPRCGHCRLARRRKAIYVVRCDADGTLLGVGTNCLAAFTRDVTAVAAASGFEHLADAVSTIEGLCGGGGVPAAELVYDLTLFLAHVLADEAAHGFVTRKDLDRLPEWAQTTGAWALDRLSPFGSRAARERHGLGVDEVLAQHGAAAAQVVAWHAGREVVVSDFDHNCRLLAREGAIMAKDANLAAAMVLSYRRAVEAQQPRQQRSSAHVGAVGERLRDVQVTVERVVPMEARNVGYGRESVAHLHVMRDVSGNLLKWFSSSHVLETGRAYTLTGTVKAHGEYRGTPETVLTRCAVAQDRA